MKNFTSVFALGTVLATVAVADAAPASPFSLRLKGHESAVALKVSDFIGVHSELASVRKAPDKTYGNWKPATEKYYGYERGNWELQDTYTKTYDTAGNTLREVDSNMEGETIVTEYAYDANNKVTWRQSRVSTDGENFTNSMKTEFTYDPVLTSLITSRTEWMWMNEDWRLVGNNYKRAITRDGNGNITSVVISTLFDGYYDPIERLEVTYGDDGKASLIHVTNLAYDGSKYYWVDNTTVKDIVWENTDGQIADVENLFIGGNRIRSAVIIAHEEDYSMTFNVTYTEGSDAYRADVVLADEEESANASIVYEPLENDGYRSTSTVYYPDGNEVEFTEVTYDAWGNNTRSYSEYRLGDEVVVEEDTRGVVEYDAEGVPVSYELSQHYEDGGKPVTEYVFRCEFLDYIDVATGVATLPDEAHGTTVYYDITGRKLSAPEKGTLCIRVQNGVANKIIAR